MNTESRTGLLEIDALTLDLPNGTRLLYDPGRTVAGADDPRLGRIDVILVSHMHGDHVGNAHNKAPNSGTCEKPDTSVSALPNSNAVNIALAKKSKIVTGSEMPPFFAAKLKANGGDPANSMLARFGGSGGSQRRAERGDRDREAQQGGGFHGATTCAVSAP